MKELKDVLLSTGYGAPGFTQFTKDWAQKYFEGYEDLERGADFTASDFLGTLAYSVESILPVLNPALLADIAFFNRVLEIVRLLKSQEKATEATP